MIRKLVQITPVVAQGKIKRRQKVIVETNLKKKATAGANLKVQHPMLQAAAVNMIIMLSKRF
jgi:hypothetical protein